MRDTGKEDTEEVIFRYRVTDDPQNQKLEQLKNRNLSIEERNRLVKECDELTIQRIRRFDYLNSFRGILEAKLRAAYERFKKNIRKEKEKETTGDKDGQERQ